MSSQAYETAPIATRVRRAMQSACRVESDVSLAVLRRESATPQIECDGALTLLSWRRYVAAPISWVGYAVLILCGVLGAVGAILHRIARRIERGPDMQALYARRMRRVA